MIIPAAIFRIVGFINGDKLEDTPQDSNLMFCYSDQGRPVVLKLESNKRDFTKDDVIAYFDNKKVKVIKEKEIEGVAGELEYLEQYEEEIEEAVEKFKLLSSDKKEIMNFKKEFKMALASKIVNEKRTIGKNSIIRTAISTGEKKETYEFKGIEYPLIVSRCIIFDNAGLPSTSGLYYYSQTGNALPITIKPIFNKENQPIELFVICLSKIATLEHFNILIDHIKRSVQKNIEKKEKTYVQNVHYDYESIKGLDGVYAILKKIGDFAKLKELEGEVALNYLEALEELKVKVNEQPKLITLIQLPINLMFKPDFMKSMLESKSPFGGLSQNIVLLNFSKEDPDVRKDKMKISTEFLLEFCKGEKLCEMNCIYHLPALKLSEEPDSWGFMQNNVQVDQSVLSSVDSFKLYKEIEGK